MSSPDELASRPRRLLVRLLRGLVILTATLLGLAVIVPLLWPIPVLKNTRSAAAIAKEIAAPHARFVDLEGLPIYIEERGTHTHARPPLLLLHGFLASTFTWREIIDPLARSGRVIAFDRPGFGLSARPLPPAGQDNFAAGHDPYSAEAQVRQTLALMDTLDIDRAILVGSQTGSTLALRVALAAPERVAALVLITPAITRASTPPWLRRLLDTAQLRRIGPLLSRDLLGRSDELIDNAWYNPKRLDKRIRQGTKRTFAVDDWDRALWRHTLAYRSADDLLARLDRLDVTTLMITGVDEQMIDSPTSEDLAEILTSAESVEISECGDLPHEECPAPTLAAIDAFLAHAIE